MVVVRSSLWIGAFSVSVYGLLALQGAKKQGVFDSLYALNNDVYPKDLIKVMKKEFLISILLCFSLGIITYFRIVLFPGSSTVTPGFNISDIGLLIALALGVQIVWSTVFGAVIPIIATKIRIDPAVISSPALTTIVDMVGITIYFMTAKIILGI